MALNTLSKSLSTDKFTLRQFLTQLVKVLLLISLCACLGYLCWQDERALVFVEAGFAIMLLVYWLPFRKMAMSPEIAWDLLALVMYFAVFLKLYELGVEQPSMRFLLGLDWIERFHGWVAHWPVWIAILTNYIVGDFVAYWCHRLFHTRWLWHMHAFHHSAKHLNWVSGIRSSFGHVVGLFLPYAVVLVFFPIPKAGAIATGILIFDTVNQHYLHSNIRFPFQRQLEWIFVTPRVHFVHHSVSRKYSDSNFGFVFTLWDRWFGTYTDPEIVGINEPLGLNYEISKWRLLLGIAKHRT